MFTKKHALFLSVFVIFSYLFIFCKKKNDTKNKEKSDINLQIKDFNWDKTAQIDHENGVIYAKESTDAIILDTDPKKDFELESPNAVLTLVTDPQQINDLAEIEYLVAYQGKKKTYRLKIDARQAVVIRKMVIPNVLETDIEIVTALYEDTNQSRIRVWETNQPIVFTEKQAEIDNSEVKMTFDNNTNIYSLKRRGFERTYQAESYNCLTIEKIVVPLVQGEQTAKKGKVNGMCEPSFSSLLDPKETNFVVCEGLDNEALNLQEQNFERYIHFTTDDQKCVNRSVTLKDNYDYKEDTVFEFDVEMNGDTKEYRLEARVPDNLAYDLLDKITIDQTKGSIYYYQINKNKSSDIISDVFYTYKQLEKTVFVWIFDNVIIYEGQNKDLTFPLRNQNAKTNNQNGNNLSQEIILRNPPGAIAYSFEEHIYTAPKLKTSNTDLLTLNGVNIIGSKDTPRLKENQDNEIVMVNQQTLTLNDFDIMSVKFKNNELIHPTLTSTSSNEYELKVKIGDNINNSIKNYQIKTKVQTP